MAPISEKTKIRALKERQSWADYHGSAAVEQVITDFPRVCPEFIKKHAARMRGIQGTVLVSLIVNTDGTVDGVELVQGIGGGCDEEAIRIIKSSPNWTPGMIKGKAVRTRMKIPISFKLG